MLFVVVVVLLTSSSVGPFVCLGLDVKQNEAQSARAESTHKGGNYRSKDVTQPEDVPLVEFVYLVFTRMPCESYRRQLRSLLLCLCDIFRTLITSLVCCLDLAS